MSIQRVAVVGAGMVGLSTAWFLQQRDVEVVVLDREDVAAGSSAGNAGWLTPSLATPLPEPAVLKFGVRAMLSASSPVYVPPSTDVDLWRFLGRFVRNCTHARWRTAMSALVQLNDGALRAFEELHAPDLGVCTRPAAPLIAAYRDEADRAGLVEELHHIAEAGQHVEFQLLTGAAARAAVPALSDEVGAALRIDGQRFLDPRAFVRGLGALVERRGGKIHTDAPVDAIDADANGATVAGEHFDAVVVATGARITALARPLGVKSIVQAGRGYSFTVATDHRPDGPIYFPAQRVACTPVGDRLRLAGMMELRAVDAPLDPRRIAAIKEAAAPLLRGVDLDDRQDEWVGARPCTADGLPLIGATRRPRVFDAGGHGMWGITLGPITGKLLAEQIVTGRVPAALRAMDPLR